MASAFLIVLFCSLGLFAITFATTSIPLLVHMSKATSKVISLVGVGLMLGTGFIVVIPEAILRGCDCPTEGANQSGNSSLQTQQEPNNIRLSIVFGYIAMMIADSFVHGHSDDHVHTSENDQCSDNGKEEVIINMTDKSVKSLKSSISGLCLHSLFDGLTIGSSLASSNVNVIQTLFWAMVLHKVSASLGVGIFIKQLHISFNQGIVIESS